MALFERITGNSNDPTVQRIPIHGFYGMMRELARGAINKQFIVDNLFLSSGEETELDWLIGQYQSQPTEMAKELWIQNMWAIMLMCEIEYPGYETQQDVVDKITSLTP